MLHRPQIFIIIYCFMSATIADAMETKPVPQEAKILTEVTGTDVPHMLLCFQNNTFVMSEQYACKLWDLTSKQSLPLNDFKVYSRYPYIFADPNKQILAIGQIKTKKSYDVTLFDVIKNSTIKNITLKDRNHLYRVGHNNFFIFQPSKPEISSFKIKVFGLKNNLKKSYSVNYRLSNDNDICDQLVYNPLQQEFTAIDNHLYKIIIIELTDKAFIKKELNNPVGHISGALYSPNGSLIVFTKDPYNTKEFYVLDLKTYSFSKLLSNDNHPLSAIVFHPTSLILATFSYSNYSLHFWHTTTLKPIASIFLNMSPDANNPKTMGFYIDFAPHGKTIIIALVNKCLEVEVPAEVLYEINKKTIFTYWILKNYQQQHSNAVPHEITQLITNALLEVSQYSLTNY